MGKTITHKVTFRHSISFVNEAELAWYQARAKRLGKPIVIEKLEKPFEREEMSAL